MKTRTQLRAAALVLALTTMSRAAQAQLPFRLGLAGGAAVPIGNTADVTSVGYNGTVTVAFNAPLIPVGLRFDGMFNELRAADEEVSSQAPDLSVSSVNANVTFNLLPLPTARVYVIGGVGYYRSEFEGLGSEGDVGFNAGAGIRFGRGRTQLFAEGRYHRANTSGDGTIEFVPITLGFLF